MSEIRFEPRPRCYLCGKLGHLVHVRLEDKLFEAPGTWDLRECSDKACGLLWMDPMPLLEDLPKAYASYYTHGAAPETSAYRRLRDLYGEVKNAHLANTLGYRFESVSWLPRWLSKLLLFFPEQRRRIEGDVMFLAAQPGGKLLDVGCGSGERMEKMRALGWTVSGVDFDEKAVTMAKGRGLDVSYGTIPGIWFSSGTFDVVIMNHVVEHVPDPIELIKECRRILKPGGKLVLTTPNSSSWGHKFLKEHWRGLEPPRHLHIFGPSSIEQTLRKAGFDAVLVRTVASAYIWQRSVMLRLHLTNQSDRFRLQIAKWLGMILSSAAGLASILSSSAGEYLWTVATKDAAPQGVIFESGIADRVHHSTTAARGSGWEDLTVF